MNVSVAESPSAPASESRKLMLSILRVALGVLIAAAGAFLLFMAVRAVLGMDRDAFQIVEFEPQTAFDANGNPLSNYSFKTEFPFAREMMSIILMVLALIAAAGILLALGRFSLRTNVIAVLFIAAFGAFPILWFSAERSSTSRMLMVTRTDLPDEKLAEITAALQPDAALATLPQECLDALALEPENRVQRVTVSRARSASGKAAFSICVVFQGNLDNWKKAAQLEFYQTYGGVLAMEATGLRGDALSQSISMQNGVMQGSFGRSNNDFWAQHRQRWMALRTSGWRPQ
ncbi:MAG TPA: hypothetical protein VEJ63_10655 [Planctomycetota bacterium]|nr:hypothetical protein [Planctomycetota bacterium]